jgi:Integrase core domain
MRRFFYRPRRRQGPLCEPRPLTAIRRQKGLSAVPGGGPGGPPPPWPQACDRHAGSAGCTEGARPALVARLRLGLPGRPTLPDPGHRRRLHPRVPGGGRRHLDLRRAARAQSRRAGCPSRRAGDDRQRQWSGAYLTRDPGVDQPGWPGLALHSPWQPTQNAFVESFIGRLRDEPLNEEIFESLAHARRLLERWRARLQPSPGRTRRMPGCRQSTRGCLPRAPGSDSSMVRPHHLLSTRRTPLMNAGRQGCRSPPRPSRQACALSAVPSVPR